MAVITIDFGPEDAINGLVGSNAGRWSWGGFNSGCRSVAGRRGSDRRVKQLEDAERVTGKRQDEVVMGGGRRG